MLSRVFHIENSSFTYLPNPTPDSWDRRSVSLPKLLDAFYIKTQLGAMGSGQDTLIIARYRHHIERIRQHLDDKKSLDRWLLLRSLHAALDDTDDVLTARTKSERQSSYDAENASEKPNDAASGAEKHIHRRGIVQDVVRHHIQDLIRLLNQQEDQTADTLSVRQDIRPSSPSRPRAPLRRFEDMDAAGPDDRQDILMGVYFDAIRPRVVSTAQNSAFRRSSLVGVPPELGRTLAASIRSNTSLLPSHATSESVTKGPDHTMKEVTMDHHEGQLEVLAPVQQIAASEETHSGVSLADLDVTHNDVWCTLVFRMVCWLMLHNFNKKDVQLPKSELLGSRMPVYIS